jgi:predicted PurR-regulated permease PerM
MEWLSGIIGVILSLLAALTLSGFTVFKTRGKKEITPSIEDKITTLATNFKNSLTVISEIESEIENRSKIVNKLQDDVKRFEQLKELSKTQVEAIAQTLRGEIAGESKKSLWRNAIITFIVSLLFFFLGYWLRGA